MEKIIRGYLEYLETERNYSSHTILSYETDLLRLVQFLRNEKIESFNQVHKESLRAYIGFLLDEVLGKEVLPEKLHHSVRFLNIFEGTNHRRESRVSAHHAENRKEIAGVLR